MTLWPSVSIQLPSQKQDLITHFYNALWSEGQRSAWIGNWEKSGFETLSHCDSIRFIWVLKVKFWGEIKQVLSRGMSSNILRCFLKRLTQAGDKRAQFQTKYMTNDFRQMQIRICGQIYVYF